MTFHALSRWLVAPAFASMTLVAAPATSSAQHGPAAAAQPAAGPSLADRLLAQPRAAAVKAIAAAPADAKAELERLRKQFDASVHSARDVPEQRKVQYDDAALDQGLKLGRLYADATKDRVPERLFAARRQRIEGTELLNARKPAEAIVKLRAALSEAVALNDLWLQIITRTNLAYGLLESGDTKSALAECEKAKALADGSDVRSKALAVFNLASLYMHMNKFDVAGPMSGEAAVLARQVGIRLWEGNALLNQGIAYRQLGDLPKAASTLASARDVLLKTQDKLGIGRTYYSLALVTADRGDVAGAIASMESSLPIIRGLDIRHSHEIELDQAQYYNTIEDAALQLLAKWHKQLGHADKAAAYTTELDALRAKRPHGGAGHSHKSGDR